MAKTVVDEGNAYSITGTRTTIVHWTCSTLSLLLFLPVEIVDERFPSNNSSFGDQCHSLRRYQITRHCKDHQMVETSKLAGIDIGTFMHQIQRRWPGLEPICFDFVRFWSVRWLRLWGVHSCIANTLFEHLLDDNYAVLQQMR